MTTQQSTPLYTATVSARRRVNVDIRGKDLSSLLTLADARGVPPTDIVHEALAQYLARNGASHGITPAPDGVMPTPACGEYDGFLIITPHVYGPVAPRTAHDAAAADEMGHLRRWNRNVERLLGYSADEMPRLIGRIMPVHARDPLRAMLVRAIKGEHIAEIETQLIHKDGHLVDVIFSLSPWFERGAITGVVAIGRDVSALKRRERDAAYVASVARACNSATDEASLLSNVVELTANWADAARILTDKNGVMHLIACEAARWDTTSEAITCFTEEQDNWPETFPERDVLASGQSIMREMQPNDEELSSGPAISTRYYDTIASVPIWASAEIVGALAVLRQSRTLPFDLQTMATLAMVAEQVGLAITKVRLLEQVQAQLQELEKAIRYKDDFLASLSHELRTPLSAILGFAVMIVENDGLGFARRREMAGDIVASAALMRSLVNDLLNLIQLREGQFTIQSEPVELAPLVQWCVRLLMPLMTVKRQIVSMQVPHDLPLVCAERSRLEQIILNLVTNANKYTPPEGTITIHAADDGEYIALSVRDTGVGISPDDARRVFALFERGEAEYSRAQGGAGIGLAVARQIVEAMGGALTMESGLGEGSTFTVRLPKAATS